MPLTHVCVWDSELGYRRVTVEEASVIYPHSTVSARSGHFVCEARKLLNLSTSPLIILELSAVLQVFNLV